MELQRFILVLFTSIQEVWAPFKGFVLGLSLACDCTQTISIKCAFNCSRGSWKAFQWRWFPHQLRPMWRIRDAPAQANFSIKQMSPPALWGTGNYKWKVEWNGKWKIAKLNRKTQTSRVYNRQTPAIPATPTPFAHSQHFNSHCRFLILPIVVVVAL